jgi:CheY-like chemotaxis protein
MHVMIVEDDSLLAIDLQVLVEDMGASSSIIVSSEEDAIAQAWLFPPTLIIADLHLREGLGVTAVHTIRSKIGFVAAVYVTGDPEEAKRLDPTALVLSKPLKSEELVQAIERLRPLFRDVD